MEVTILNAETVEFKDEDGQVYHQCRRCKRFGAKGWVHFCAPSKDANWHFSLGTVKSILQNQKRNSLKTMGFLSTPSDWTTR